MVLLPSQLAAHNPGERINYHIFTFCLDICGTFCRVIYLCCILWVFHPNHLSSGLWIQKSTETKSLALLNFLTWIILLTIDTGYVRIWHRVFPSIAMDMWGRRLLGPSEQLQNLAWTSERPLNFLFQPLKKNYPVLLSLRSWWRQIIMSCTIHMATTIFLFKRSIFFGSLWVLHKAPYGELKRSEERAGYARVLSPLRFNKWIYNRWLITKITINQS